MDAKTRSIRILPVAVILAGLLALQLVWLPKKSDEERRQYEDKINLSLRQAGHRLLKAEGNLTDALAPVRRISENEFQLRLDQSFNYDSLPVFLKSAFDQYEIAEDYLVSVKDCEENKLVLGYARQDFEQRGDVPCGGREQDAGCFNIAVVFTDLAPPGGGGWQYKLTTIGLLGTLAYLAFAVFSLLKNRGRRTEPPLSATPEAVAETMPPESGGDILHFGRSAFDFSNQMLQTGETRQELTFREAKLLDLFCRNVNQLLDRNYILQEVWEDEGVIVGRSLDVFVSRLRKILRVDDSVQIKNVHGIGYRFEVVENQSFKT